MTHIKLNSNSSQTNIIALCAGKRLVKEENINGKIPGLHGKLNDSNGDFVYACYVTSDYLDEKVRAERTGFDFEEDGEDIFTGSELSQVSIKQEVLKKVSEHLSEHLEASKKAAKIRIEQFVAEKAPRYRPIMARLQGKDLNVDPNISDKDLEMVLHKELSEIEGKLISDGHSLMEPKDGEGVEEYEGRLEAYLKTVDDIKKSDLASYVTHRKVILDLLGKAITKGSDGKYSNEKIIHQLIMPLGKTSSDLNFDSCNLWLIDERLAFHDYLASDKTLNSAPITGSMENKEPDLLGLTVYDQPILVSEGTKLPLASIVIVELKRPMRNDAREGEDKNPIEQVLGYLKRIRQGGVTTASGRPIPYSDDIPAFCYVICDITDTMKDRAINAGGILTSDKMGYFIYNPGLKAYIEIISFDRLLNSAKERNRAFFDKLSLPTN